MQPAGGRSEGDKIRTVNRLVWEQSHSYLEKLAGRELLSKTASARAAETALLRFPLRQ